MNYSPLVVSLLLLLSSSTIAEDQKPVTLGLNRELRDMELVRYWVKDHLEMAEGGVKLEFVIRFPAEKQLSATQGGIGNKGFHTFLTFILDKGNRISASYDRFRRAIGFYAWDRATKRHLIVESFPADWRQGEAHSLSVSWGDFLTLAIDGRKVLSKRWEGLAGPWGQTEPKQAYLLVGSIRMWAHTLSDFLAERITFSPKATRLADRLATDDAGPPSRMAIPKLAAPPVVDGVVDDKEWALASAVTGFANVQSLMGMEQPTVILAGYDDQKLYFGIRAFRKQAQLIDAACHARDGAVYLDDAVEIFLRPNGRGPYYQFIGNSFGTIYDSYDKKPAWNGAWDFKTHHADQYWSGEAAIPFADLRCPSPKPGDKWTANFCRELSKMSEIASWSLMHRRYSQPDRFGELTFSSGEAVRLLGITGWQRGKPTAIFETAGPCKANVTISDGEQTLVREERELRAGAEDLTLELPAAIAEGEFVLTYECRSQGGQVLASGLFPFTTLAPFEVELRKYPSFEYVDVVISTGGMPRLPANARARAAILDSSGSALAKGETEIVKTQQTHTVRLPTAELKPGHYQVRGELADATGSVLHSKTVELTKSPKPWWAGSRAGITDKVLPPWTPMECRGTTVSCWGREMAFGQSVFPEQIVSQGKELLAGPIVFSAKCDGERVVLRQGTCDVHRAADHEVALKAIGAGGPLRLAVKIHAEYDGMVRFDWAIDGAENTAIDALTLDIPLKAEHSILMHENDGSRGWAGLTGDETRRMVFRPTIWLGDDHRGLCWFAESSQGWRPSTVGAVEIEREGDVRHLKLNMIRERTRLGSGLKYTFGLMATPVRPLPEHVRNWRLCTGIGRRSIQNVVMSERVVYPASGQLDNRRGTLELWLRPAWPSDPEAAKGYKGWQEIGAVEYGPFLGKSQVAAYYMAHQQQLVVNHYGLHRDAKTGGRKRSAKRLLTASQIDLRPSNDYHLALTWGDELSLFLDGKKCASTSQAGLVPGEQLETLEDEELLLGAHDHWKGRTAFTFDELRVSARPRDEAELKASRPIRDEATLLLDHFSETFRPDGEDGRTHPEVAPTAGGVPTVGCAFVPAKFGSGVRTLVKPPGSWLAIAHDEVGLTHACDWRWHKYMGAWDLLTPPAEYKVHVDAVHRATLQYYVYTYKCLAPLHPNYDRYFHEWGLKPRVRWLNPTNAPDARNYDGDSACSNSPYSDYFVAGFERALKQFDLDGIYLDGNTKPSLCTNANHGCGYRDGTGQWRGSYPIFATREMLKRLYAVTHLNKPEGIVDVHESFCLCIPTTSFCDVIYTGEHEPFSPERIDEIRVRYGRRAWGMPIEVLGSMPNHVRFAQRYWAYMLIHDARVRPAGAQARNDMQRKTANIRRVLEPFRGPECKWLPYYEASPFESLDADLYVSAWSRPRGDYLLAIAYFGKSPERITGRIRLKLDGEWCATNPLTEEPGIVEKGVLRVPIAFERFRLVHLTLRTNI